MPFINFDQPLIKDSRILDLINNFIKHLSSTPPPPSTSLHCLNRRWKAGSGWVFNGGCPFRDRSVVRYRVSSAPLPPFQKIHTYTCNANIHISLLFFHCCWCCCCCCCRFQRALPLYFFFLIFVVIFESFYEIFWKHYCDFWHVQKSFKLRHRTP